MERYWFDDRYTVSSKGTRLKEHYKIFQALATRIKQTHIRKY